MKIVIIAGAPAVGKTSVVVHLLDQLKHNQNQAAVVAKLDCIDSHDQIIYETRGYKALTGLSKNLCPDHYLATNLSGLNRWASQHKADYLMVETAGLCNRCAPFLSGALNICVIDSTASIKSPEKLGPMITTADVLVMTKCDMISQAERDILMAHLKTLNPDSAIYTVNGLTGAGAKRLSKTCLDHLDMFDMDEQSLRYDMPAAICSYCVGERRIGPAYHQGMVNYMDLGGDPS